MTTEIHPLMQDADNLDVIVNHGVEYDMYADTVLQ